VDQVARDVDAVIGVWLPNDVLSRPIFTRLDAQAIEVDEQVLGAGTSGDVIVGEIGRSVVVDQPVAGGSTSGSRIRRLLEKIRVSLEAARSEGSEQPALGAS
jgi:hypothetical protein